jgi:hypothetical protein
MKLRTKTKAENAKNQSKKARRLDKFDKFSLRENNMLTKSISTVFLILTVTGLFAFILVGLFSFDLLEMPAFIKNINNMLFGTENNIEETQNNDDDIYDYLRNNSNNSSNTENKENKEIKTDDFNDFIFERQITLDNLRDIISKIAFPDNMLLEMKVKYYADGINVQKTIDMTLWKKDVKYKYELRVDSKLEEVYINNAIKEHIENKITNSSVTKPADDLFSFNNIPHIPNIDYYLSLLESGEIDRYSIDRHNDENIVQIRYWARSLNQWETIRFSLDTGIVLSVVCYAGDNKSRYYECVTFVRKAYYNSDEQAGEQTAIMDSMFEIK